MAPGNPLGRDNYFSAGQVRVGATGEGVIHVAWTAFDEEHGGAEMPCAIDRRRILLLRSRRDLDSR